MKSTGVLLVNLGTPKSPTLKDVRAYLHEFLLDPRVINYPWLKRQLLVRGLIVPNRCRQSTEAYKTIWTDAGSPLLVYGQKVRDALQHTLGISFHVELAMRYQIPSIKEGIHKLINKGIDHLIILPLFPHYASATTGSVHQRVMEELAKFDTIPKLTFVNQYASHPSLIKAFCTIAKDYDLNSYDNILFSFHGLPMQQLKQGNPQHCLSVNKCCQTMSAANQNCYSAQCHATMQAIANELQLSESNYQICFQSRLGKEPWLQPYANETIQELAKKGAKKILVFCPSFVCDCLETTFEFGIEYSNEFKHAGGERLDLVSGLNEHPMWIQALKDIVIMQNKT